MKKYVLRFIFVAIATLALTSIAAFAYRVNESSSFNSPTEDTVASAIDDSTSADASADGPVRLARFSYISGNVTWRASETDAWSTATINLPVREGTEIWVTDAGRAEVQFDDGSLLRLGNGAVATLQTLFSDADGEFTEIKVSEGLSSLVLKHQKSIFQIDTPFAAIKSTGPAKVRVGVDNTVEVAVRAGTASIQGMGGDSALDAGDYVELSSANSSYSIDRVPALDSWDRWNDSRDAQMADAVTQKHVPSNIGLVIGDLSSYGSWRTDPQYGYVWTPRIASVDWRPYQFGDWVWVEPFGWTWVSNEPWGWAPYHYGTWVHESWGWAWVPGPVNQYWCPAVVNFSEYDGSIAWVALAPGEVIYPSAFSLGFHNRGWSFFFSIGGTAVILSAQRTLLPCKTMEKQRSQSHSTFHCRSLFRDE